MPVGVSMSGDGAGVTVDAAGTGVDAATAGDTVGVVSACVAAEGRVAVCFVAGSSSTFRIRSSVSFCLLLLILVQVTQKPATQSKLKDVQ